MTEKRNPTERTEERSGEDAAPGPPDLPEGAEHAEYTGYHEVKEGDETAPREAEARREADLQPDGPDSGPSASRAEAEEEPREGG